MAQRNSKKHNEQADNVRFNRSLEMIDPDTAFVDVASAEHWVCIPADRAEENVRRFGAYTSDLYQIRDWLLEHGVKSVGMESTGVYWLPLYQVLEDAGLQVAVVNARDVKSVKGRPKTDKHDCMWGQRLLSYGLLRSSFRPASEICELRSIWRMREQWLQEGARSIQRMQKALCEMNLLLANVVSNITGKTGMAIIKAILDGERDPVVLAKRKDPRVRSSKEEIAEALKGDYRDEQLFLLGKAVQHYEFIQGQLSDFDNQLKQRLKVLPKKRQLSDPERQANAKDHSRYKKRNPNAPDFDTRSIVHELTGIDLGAIPGLRATLLLAIITEVGLNMSKWPTAKHFASWLGLCPNPRISAGKDLGTHTKKCSSRAARYFRLAAGSLSRSNCYLGDFYRRMRARHGGAHAVTATAHKLAVLFYKLVRDGEQYREIDRSAYEQMIQQQRVANLKKRARQLGFELQAVEPEAAETMAALQAEKERNRPAA